MIPINQFIIGIRPSFKMFRVPSLSGIVIDSILAERGKKPFDDEYFTQVATNLERNGLQLVNKDQSNLLRIDEDNLVFKKYYHNNTIKFKYEQVFSEFEALWKTINDILGINNIRRIGIAVEHQIKLPNVNVNKKLMETITSFRSTLHPAKFFLKYEERLPTKEGLAPDIDKSDFINIIYNYYSSEIDAEHPDKEAINANIDIQRYYSPLLTSNVIEEVRKLYRTFDIEKKKFEDRLREMGVLS